MNENPYFIEPRYQGMVTCYWCTNHKQPYNPWLCGHTLTDSDPNCQFILMIEGDSPLRHHEMWAEYGWRDEDY